MNLDVKETTRTIHPDGSMDIQQVETTKTTNRRVEPDYIKIYTGIWCEANQIPPEYRKLFLALATRMSYTDATNLEESQIVYVMYPSNRAILKECGWSTELDNNGRFKGQYSLSKGLQALCKCNAIKRVKRGVYQINPSYAGRGSWRYDSELQRGGIEKLRIFYEIDIDGAKNYSEIVWADDGTDTEENRMMRDSLGVSAKDKAVITDTQILDIDKLKLKDFTTV